MKFKKIMSVLASAIMLSSTIGFAAAANYPAPFVSGGAANAAIVVGSAAVGPTDMAAAIDLKDNLNGLVTAPVTTVSTSVTACPADDGTCVKFKRSSDLFNLGESMSDFYTSLSEDELSTVLASGIFTNDAGDEFDYEQTIAVGTGLNLSYFQDSDLNDDKPVIGFNLQSGDHILNYTLDFTDPAEAGSDWGSASHANDLESTELTMLGRTYYVLAAENVSAEQRAITLLDTANSAVISEGTPSTITVGDKSYEVAIDTVGDSDAGGYVFLTVDGKSTKRLEAGGTYKISADTTLAVKNVRYSPKDTGISKVEVSVGSGKIVLTDGEEVQINTEDVSNTDYAIKGSTEPTTGVLTSYIQSDGSNLQSITLQWDLGDKALLMPGSELVLPGFETIKIAYSGFNIPRDEVTKVEGQTSGNGPAKLTAELEDGSVSINFLYLNASATGIGGLGKAVGSNVLVTDDTVDTPTIALNEDDESIFAATWIGSGEDFQSALYQIDSIEDANGDNKTIIKNLADTTKKITLTKVTDTADSGNIQFTLDAASDDAKTATISMSRIGSAGHVYADRLVTKEGMVIHLPVLTGDVDVGDPDYIMNFTEENEDGDIQAGSSFTVTLGINSDKDALNPTDTSVDRIDVEEDSDYSLGYVESALATAITLDEPSSGLSSAKIDYAGSESSADVFIAEGATSITGGGTGAQVLVVSDTDVASVSTKNLIVVGGSCVNTAAAQILGSSTPLCGDAWTAATGAGPGKWIIKTIASPFAAADSGKVAMLVAGYEAAETQSAVTKALEGVTSDVGTSQVYPIVGTA